MSLATADITYNLADLVGVAHYRGTSITATTNIPNDTVIDTDGNAIRLGSGKGTINASGTGTITVWIPGTGSNPATWQTYIHIKYRDPQRDHSPTATYGPFTITASGDLADLIEEQAIQPTYAGELVAQMEGIRDETIQISGIDTSDEAVAALVETAAGPLTQAALSATYGRVVPPGLGNGTTDATAGIQAVIDAANTAGDGVIVPAGDFRITAPLENVRRLHLAEGARIFADAAMDAVVRTQIATRMDNGYITGKGTIDAGTNAEIGIHLRYFLYFEVSGVQVLGGNDAAIKLGDTLAAGRSAEAIVSNVRLYNEGSVVAGSRGILVENSGDHSVSQVLIQNYEVGVYLPAGGNGMFHDVHVWTEPAKGNTTTGFEDHSNNSHYVACHADTPTEYGWRLYGYQTSLVQCGTYINPTAGSATDNIVVGIKLEGANSIASIVNHFFLGGAADKRLKADIEATDGNYGLISIVPVVGQHTVTVRAFNGRAPGLVVRDSVTAGTSLNADATTPTAGIGVRIRTNGVDRWRLQSDGVAESGANAGSGLLLSRYDDAGVKLADVFSVVRTGTWIQYSNMLFGPSASIIPDGTNGLKIGTNSAQKLGFFGNTPVTKPTAPTAADASTVDTTYGTEEAAVLNNVRQRLNEVVTKLQALGLLT